MEEQKGVCVDTQKGVNSGTEEGLYGRIISCLYRLSEEGLYGRTKVCLRTDEGQID